MLLRMKRAFRLFEASQISWFNPFNQSSEVFMPAYLLLLAALLSRVIPHAGWYGFTAVGGSLLYFGAHRNWREMLLPVAAFAGVDYYLTTHVYGYDFIWQSYLVTWAWYATAIVLGRILLA